MVPHEGRTSSDELSYFFPVGLLRLIINSRHSRWRRKRHMGSSQLFHHHPIMVGVWVATWALSIIPETVLLGCSFVPQRTPAKADPPIEDRCARIGTFLASGSNSLLHSLFPASSWERTGRPSLPFGIAVWLGGIFLRLYSIGILGRFFTFDVAIANGHRIVEQGPYAWLRHPSYLGSLLARVSFGMTMTNWLAMLLPVCCLAAAYAYRIPIEEREDPPARPRLRLQRLHAANLAADSIRVLNPDE